MEKLTEEAKTVITEDASEKLTALAVIHGMKRSEYLRLLIEEKIYGSFHVTSIGLHSETSMAKQRLDKAYLGQ